MVQTEQQQDILVVRPARDIVASYLDELRSDLQKLIAEGQTNLAIDLANVSMIDSKGLALFMMCHKSLTARGGNLTVVTDNADLQHLFHVMRLDQHFAVRATL